MAHSFATCSYYTHIIVSCAYNIYVLHLFHSVCYYFSSCLCKEIDNKVGLDTFYLIFNLYTSINKANPGRLIYYSIMHTIEKPNRNVFTMVVTKKKKKATNSSPPRGDHNAKLTGH